MFKFIDDYLSTRHEDPLEKSQTEPPEDAPPIPTIPSSNNLALPSFFPSTFFNFSAPDPPDSSATSSSQTATPKSVRRNSRRAVLLSVQPTEDDLPTLTQERAASSLVSQFGDLVAHQGQVLGQHLFDRLSTTQAEEIKKTRRRRSASVPEIKDLILKNQSKLQLSWNQTIDDIQQRVNSSLSSLPLALINDDQEDRAFMQRRMQYLSSLSPITPCQTTDITFLRSPRLLSRSPSFMPFSDGFNQSAPLFSPVFNPFSLTLDALNDSLNSLGDGSDEEHNAFRGISDLPLSAPTLLSIEELLTLSCKSIDKVLAGGRSNTVSSSTGESVPSTPNLLTPRRISTAKALEPFTGQIPAFYPLNSSNISNPSNLANSKGSSNHINS